MPADAPEADDEGRDASLLGATVDGIRLSRRLGQGSSGTVYEGRQPQEPCVVAVKVMHPWAAAPGLVRRFEYEAETLARLDHAGIARFLRLTRTRVHDVEVPCLVMELVPAAKPITLHAGTLRIPVRDRVGLVLEAAEAVAHAHQHGVLHRDLKPGNILVGADGRVKVIDFGWARGLDSAAVLRSAHTQFGTLIGTPQYMSPEQFDADPAAVDLRSDVYALGAVLQELLTGKPPHEYVGGPLFHFATQVRDEPPAPLPSDDRDIDRPLRAIVARCLEKDKGRRYSSATELASDLRHALAGEPIAAASSGLLDSLRSLARKHAIAAAATALAAMALVAAAATSTLFFLRSEQARLRERAMVVRLGEESRRAGAEAESARRRLAVANLYRIQAATEGANIAAAEAILAETTPLVGPGADGGSADGLPIELRCLQAPLRQPIGAFVAGTAERPAADVTAVAIDPAGRRVATGSADGTARLWDAASGRLEHALPTDGPVARVAFTADGSRLATGTRDGLDTLWDVEGGLPVHNAEATDSVPGTSIDATSVTTPPVGTGSTAKAVTSPDGTRMVLVGPGSTLRLVDATSGTTLTRIDGFADRVALVAFSPDSRTIAAAPRKGPPSLLRGSDGARLATLDGHAGPVTALAFAPDSGTLATASADRTVRLWEATRGVPRRILRGHHDRVNALAWSADGRRLVSGSHDGMAIRWDTTNVRGPSVLEGHEKDVAGVAFLPGSGRLVSWSLDGTTRAWDVATASPSGRIGGPREPLHALAVSPDGSTLAVGGNDDLVILHDAATGDERLRLRGHTKRVLSIVFSPSGELLASASDDGTVRLWETTSGRCRKTLVGHGAAVLTVGFSPDGGRVASASADGTARLWPVVDGAEPLVLEAHAGRVRTLAFDPSGATLATGSDDGTACLWHAADGTPAATLRDSSDAAVTSLAFDSSGRRLFTGSMRGGGDVWDTATGSRLARLDGHTSEIRALVVSPDGTRLATASSDGTARLWDATDGALLLVLRGHGGPVLDVAFSPEGRDLATASADGTVRLWSRSDRDIDAARRRAARRDSPAQP